MELYNKKLKQIQQDPEQFTAFQSNTSIVVKAGPGSGKTTILTLKIMQLLNEKIAFPRGLACITYSKEAAKEFTERLQKMGCPKRKNVSLGTVHSFCISQIIIPFAKLFNDDFPLPLDIITDAEKQKIFNSTLTNLGIDKYTLSVEEMDKERSFTLTGLSTVPVTLNPTAAKVAYEYEQQLKKLKKTDFIEIVKYSRELINREEYIRRCLESRFPWILVDEYQDFGKPLHEMILSLLSLTNIKVFAVGDPDQSIYGFNGAIPEYLLELYDKPDISSVHLKTNYRSHQDIIDVSSIALNVDDREYKAGIEYDGNAEFHFITCEEELDTQYNYVVNTIIPNCQNQGIPLQEICVLVKDGNSIKNLSTVMKEKQIPHYFSKFEFAKSDVVLWLRSCALWLVNPTSQSFTEIVNFWIQLLKNETKHFSDEETLMLQKKLYTILEDSKKYAENLNDWLTYLEQELNLAQILNESVTYLDENKYLETLKNYAQSGSFKGYNLSQFSQIGKPKDQVTLSTRHSSKGLEFEVVIMLGMEKGVFPYYKNERNSAKLNEERRVFFVCLTRAKRICYLLRSKKYTRKTRNGIITFDHKPSMFWNELYEVCENKKLVSSTN
ncbi:hypothetical protein IEK_01267 [Bacillus toyonensis]|uniref:DNA 3'-5' helicase n=2 Tax=Bacillus cereus group TaxID=86661 RepID=A0A7V7V7E5_9BACI|nr:MULTISPECIES: ATP-dependent helicase [Bacillus cereus group]EJV52618.1 hypothetical protein IEK_01267 [Bacillus toyonensis]KAB2444724.1 ATP-dependent helicase [Bacillus luti]